MNYLFITDPFETLQPGHDSTLALIRACLEREQTVWQAEIQQITFSTTQGLSIEARQINAENRLGEQIHRFHPQNNARNLIIWMRKDPPVNQAYIHACQLLRLSRAPVLNAPDALLSCNEKLLALEFPEYLPNTLISQDVRQIGECLDQWGRTVLKPIQGMAGDGIVVLERGDKNSRSLIEILTRRGTQPIVVQEYLEAIAQGDKRIFLLNGEPVGAILRVPSPADHRANMAAGGQAIATSLSAREREICRALKPRLQELGLWLVGLDLIGEQLTELNITSPTGLEEIQQFDRSDPAGQIVEWSLKYFCA